MTNFETGTYNHINDSADENGCGTLADYLREISEATGGVQRRNNMAELFNQ
jgi:hypothetical protein